VKLKLATPLSRLQVGLRARPLKAHYLVNSFFGRYFFLISYSNVMNKGWIKGKRIKIVVYLTNLRVNWTFFGMSGPV
jgi:hypothetical protein